MKLFIISAAGMSSFGVTHVKDCPLGESSDPWHTTTTGIAVISSCVAITAVAVLAVVGVHSYMKRNKLRHDNPVQVETKRHENLTGLAPKKNLPPPVIVLPEVEQIDVCMVYILEIHDPQ